MKLTQLSLAALLSVVSIGAMAQAKAPEPDYTLSFNVGATTDYRYRGISQTRFKPTIQGGVDFAHKSGFYLGAWGSGIQWIKDAGKIATNAGTPTDVGSANLEIDLYGGYKSSINSDVAFDVGVLRYEYVGSKFNNLTAFNGWATPKANTTEIYGAVSMGPVTAKYSHAVSNLFGNADSKGSGYFDLTASFDLGGGWSVVPHLGYQRVAGNPSPTFSNSLYSYTDYSVTVNKDIGNGFVGSLMAVGTNAKKNPANGIYAYAAPDSTGNASLSSRNLGRNGLVLSVKYNF
jgi:uncharacterized protein (TIGR02001 family)